MFAKHSKSFSLIDSLATEVDRMQRTLGRCKRKEARGAWQRRELADVTAEVDSLGVGDQPGIAPFVNARRQNKDKKRLPRFSHPLEDSDPDIPILKKAKAQYAKLQ